MAQVKPIVHMSLKFTNYNARARLLVHLFFFFLISNVNFIKSAEGRNPKKIYIQKNSMKYTKDTYATILLLLVSHSGNEPSSTHVA
jgi:hypothetical protein